MEVKLETSVEKIVADFNKAAEKKATKKHNEMLSYIMKATARDQQKAITISKLQRRIGELEEDKDLLLIENEVKEQLLIAKDKEVKLVQNENKKLHGLLEEMQRKLNNDVVEDNKPTRISLKRKINVTPKREIQQVVSTTVGTTELEKFETPKKRTAKKSKETTNVTNFLYNLRKRSKPK